MLPKKMMSGNYNLYFMALVLFTTDIRSENDLYIQPQPKKLRKSMNNNNQIIIEFNSSFFLSVYVENMPSERSES